MSVKNVEYGKHVHVDDNTPDKMEDERKHATIIASELIERNTLEYGKHILNNHFTSPIDGLKKVKRRIIYTKDPDSKVGGMQLVSDTLAIHNYGDQSIYDTAIKMAESYRNGFILLELQGTTGSYGGDKAAAPRYTKFKMSKFCKDLFYTGVNFKTLTMESTEDLNSQEISYFIPRLPTALLYGNESIGFGYKSRTVPLLFENVCDLVIDYAKCKDKVNWNYSRHATKMLPSFPIHVFLKNKDELVSAYRKGDFEKSILTEGLYIIKANNTVLFKTISFGIPTNSVRESLIRCLSDKGHWLHKADISFKPLSEDINYADFQITAKRGCNLFEIIDKLKSIIKIRNKTHIFNNFVYNKKMINMGVPSIIKMWYRERYRSILGGKKHRQQILQREIMRIETYLIICDHVDDVVKILKTKVAELSETYLALKKRFDLSQRQCEVLINAKLLTLVNVKRDELEAQFAKLVKELEEIVASFIMIDEEIGTDVAKLKKKYSTDTTFSSREISFIGCLIIDGYGVVQLTCLDDVMKIGDMYRQSHKTVIIYRSKIKQITISRQKFKSLIYQSNRELPYTSHATNVHVAYNKYPWVFTRSGGRVKCIDGDIHNTKTVTNYISNKPWVCHRTKGIYQTTVDKLNETPRLQSKVLYAFDLVDDCTEYVMISINSAHQQVMRLQKVNLKTKKLLLSGAGDTTVLAVLAVDTKRVILNVRNSKYSIIDIPNLSKLIKDELTDVNLRMFKRKL